MPYLTPDSPPEDTVCFKIVIPNDIGWIGIFKGAVSELIKSYNFEAFGTSTPEETAAVFLDAYDLMVFAECDMACCYDLVEHRITSGGGMEIRVNGGDWTPDPDDPRTTAPTMPPITMDETHTKCDAATNAATHINDIISATSEQLGGTGSIIEIAAAIALAIFALFLAPETIPAIAPVILPLIGGLIFLGQAAWDAYFTTDVHSQILCALYCNIENDGTFTQADYDGFIAQLTTDLPASLAKDMFIALVSRIGLVGMNDYAAIGTSASADCSACDCTTCEDIPVSTVEGTFIERGVTEDGLHCYVRYSSLPHGGSSHEQIDIAFNETGYPSTPGLCAKILGYVLVAGTPSFINSLMVLCEGAEAYITEVDGTCVRDVVFESDAGMPFTIDIIFDKC